jgi:hypothetical protein
VGWRDQGDVESVEGVPPLVHETEEEEEERAEPTGDVAQGTAEQSTQERRGSVERRGVPRRAYQVVNSTIAREVSPAIATPP